MYVHDVGVFEFAGKGICVIAIAARTGRVLEIHCLKKSLLDIVSLLFIEPQKIMIKSAICLCN